MADKRGPRQGPPTGPRRGSRQGPKQGSGQPPPPRTPSRPAQRGAAAPGRRGDERAAAKTSWDALASWYDGWVGPDGSSFHQEVAVPAIMQLLAVQAGERVLDVGAGQGVLAPHVARLDATYTGVDASPRLLKLAVQHHGKNGRFLLGDANNLAGMKDLEGGSFDAVTFLLSLQDMDPLERVLSSAAWALKPGGRLAMILTHPAFRIPRQSGWGWDEGRKLQYRRIDSYLSQLAVPLKALPQQPQRPGATRDTNRETSKEPSPTTRSFHRPISVYVNTLADAGLVIDRMSEIPSHRVSGPATEEKAAERARLEIPIFLGLRARKLG